MTRGRLARLARLERLRELMQQRAALALRERRREHEDACAAEVEAMAALEVLADGRLIGDGKTLDVGRYFAVLAMESAAFEVLTAASQRRHHAEESEKTAVEALRRAKAETGAVEARQRRLSEQVLREEEVRDADRLADLRACVLRGGA